MSSAQSERNLPIYHSDIFWHLCGRAKSEEESFQILLKILREKKLVRPNIEFPLGEHIHDGRGGSRPTWNFNYCCFADIPFAFLKYHIGNYGNVGLGFKRAMLISKGALPALYVPEMGGEPKQYNNLSVSSVLEEVSLKWREIYDSDRQRWRDLTWRLETVRSLLKQFSINDEPNPYYEREWRIFSTFEFKLEEVEAVIFPKKFVSPFTQEFPQIPYSIAELINS